MKYIWICIIVLLLTPLSVQATTPEAIKDYAKGQKTGISFYYENLVTGEKISHNPDKVFQAASTIKLPLVLYIYELASQEKLNLDSKIAYHSSYYYEGSGVIRYEKNRDSYTVKDLAQKSMVHSDNIAYSMLRSKVGVSNFKSYLRSVGGRLVDTNGYTTMNCSDYAKYIKRYYQFTLENEALGQQLTSYWQNTVFNEHIVAGVPHLEVGHKIGWLPRQNLYHDGGVVYHEQPYVLIIMNQGMEASKQANIFKTLTEKINTYHEINYINEEMLPGRTLAKMLDEEITWQPETNQAMITFGKTTLILDKESKSIYLNDEEIINTNVFYKDSIYITKDFIVNQLLIPLSELPVICGADIQWDDASCTAYCKIGEDQYLFDTKNNKAYKNQEETKILFLFKNGKVFVSKTIMI